MNIRLAIALHILLAALFAQHAYCEPVKKNGLVIIPLIFYTPETRWAGSIPLIYYFRDKDADPESRPSNLNLLTFYSQEQQKVLQMSVEHYIKDGRYRLYTAFTYSDYPNKFYGIGEEVRPEAENYVSEYTKFELRLMRRMRDSLYAGIQAEAEDFNPKDPDEGGMIDAGDVYGNRGGIFSGAGLLGVWDNRDNVFSPSSGSYHQLGFMAISSALGADFDYQKTSLDLRWYMPSYASNVLAVQGYMESLTGKTPFNRLAKIGGPNFMRGYFQGRYRDNNMAGVQAEYRAGVWHGLGIAVFAGSAEVAPSIDAFNLSDLKNSAGVGLRYMLDRKEKINVRLDVGFGEGDSGVYLVFLEAF